jgi:hypothetical protein
MDGAEHFVLFDFSRTELREIVRQISAKAPNAIDPTLRAYFDNKGADTSSRNGLRPGDGFISAAGAIFVLLGIFWWLSSHV